MIEHRPASASVRTRALRPGADPDLAGAPGRDARVSSSRRFSSNGMMTVLVLCGLTAAAPARPARADDADSANAGPPIRIGSKAFTESVILGEIIAHLSKESGFLCRHRRQLGGTQVLWKALLAGEIDVYAEYTGTIAEEIFAGGRLSGEQSIRDALSRHGVRMSRPLGFHNNYALGMTEKVAARLDMHSISDIARHPQLRLGFSNEFMSRADGWPRLQSVYQLPHEHVRGLEHDLAYRGLDNGSLDVIDLYTTDAEIKHYNLRVLKDDRSVFPEYAAVVLYREDLEQRAASLVDALKTLEGAIDNDSMIGMNEQAKLRRVPETRVAAEFLEQAFDMPTDVIVANRTARLWKSTREHLYLVSVSVAAAIVMAVPLGVVAAKQAWAGQAILGIVGVLQTVPSLALFVFLIPLFGLGARPAIAALFLYSLLPIVRNTYAGLHDIPATMHESAVALGLPPAARLRLIELPLASRSILAGIKTAVVINVGTATLGGFIGAGGYGDPIITGIRLDRVDLILEGAVPAALMALASQGLFELIERRLVPRGLRLNSER